MLACAPPDPITIVELEPCSESTFTFPGNCDAFVECATVCDPADAACREDCGHIVNADPPACTEAYCEHLITECGSGDAEACAKLLDFCDGTPESTTSSG